VAAVALALLPSPFLGLPPPEWLAWPSVLLFGAGVGASELIARYRDAPFVALRTGSALWYIFVNAVAALIAYALILLFDQKFGFDGTKATVVQAMVAGFGAMVFFRSSLFTMKVGDNDVAVGPAIFFQVLLFATDRDCDRQRAKPRSEKVADIMQGVSFEQASDALPNFCFELMQNVPASEVQQFRQVVDALASSSKMGDSVKALNLGLMLINVVGSQVLRAAVKALGEQIQGPAKLEIDVLTRLQGSDFSKAYPLLVDVCFIMSGAGTLDSKKKAKESLLNEMAPLAQQAGLDNGNKMTILGLALQRAVGDAVLLTALLHIWDGIKLSDPAEDRGAGAAPQVPEIPSQEE
jgi:hypothetical protein